MLDRKKTLRQIDDDLAWLESRYQRLDLPGWPDALVYDSGGSGDVLIFVPVLPPFDVIHVPNIKHFIQKYRVVAYRRRESRDHPIFPDERATEIAVLMDRLSIESAHFCGLNEGAIAVSYLAQESPQRIKSIVCTCIGMDNLVSGFQRWFTTHFPFTPSAALIGQMVRLFALPTAADGYLVSYLWSKTPNAKATLLNGVLPIYENYFLPIKHLTMPVLNIQSSPVVSLDSAQRFVNALPRGELKILPGKAHLCMWTHAAEFNQLMEEFYAGLEVKGQASSRSQTT